MKDQDFISKLLKHFKGRNDISTDELFAFFTKEEGKIPVNTISWRIYHLKEKGILTHVGRATYAVGKTDKGNFIPFISAHVKKIYSQIKKELPYLNISIWDTRLLNSFMIHQIGRFFIVVETEKEGMESVFNLLSATNKNVFLNPDNKTLERYASNFNESIIIQQLITEAPTLQVQGIDTISIEKLIVDCLAEKELLFAHQEELDNIFSSIAERFNISIKSARRYASRRGQSAELDKVLHTYFKVSALNEKSAKL
ncbi:MAG: DUF6577 family protein [Bacteroidota bacterium]